MKLATISKLGAALLFSTTASFAMEKEVNSSKPSAAILIEPSQKFLQEKDFEKAASMLAEYFTSCEQTLMFFESDLKIKKFAKHLNETLAASKAPSLVKERAPKVLFNELLADITRKAMLSMDSLEFMDFREKISALVEDYSKLIINPNYFKDTLENQAIDFAEEDFKEATTRFEKFLNGEQSLSEALSAFNALKSKKKDDMMETMYHAVKENPSLNHIEAFVSIFREYATRYTVSGQDYSSEKVDYFANHVLDLYLSLPDLSKGQQLVHALDFLFEFPSFGKDYLKVVLAHHVN